MYFLSFLPALECVIICYCPQLNTFWDFKNTPNLKVFQYMGNKHLLDITQIEEAINLEYFKIDVRIVEKGHTVWYVLLWLLIYKVSTLIRLELPLLPLGVPPVITIVSPFFTKPLCKAICLAK